MNDTATATPPNVETHAGTVHAGQYYLGRRDLLGPACQKFRPDSLHYALPTDAAVTCHRCLAKADPFVGFPGN